MRKIHAQRFRLVATVCVAAFLALGTYWLSSVFQRSVSNQAKKKPDGRPDFIVENFNFVALSEKGEPRYRVEGETLTHYPDTDIATINKPYLISLDPSRPTETIKANHGFFDDPNSVIKLKGNVSVRRPATASDKKITINTPSLDVFVDEDIMKSNAPITFKRGNSTMRGTGMIADNSKKEWRLLKDVRLDIQKDKSN